MSWQTNAAPLVDEIASAAASSKTQAQDRCHLVLTVHPVDSAELDG